MTVRETRALQTGLVAAAAGVLAVALVGCSPSNAQEVALSEAESGLVDRFIQSKAELVKLMPMTKPGAPWTPEQLGRVGLSVVVDDAGNRLDPPGSLRSRVIFGSSSSAATRSVQMLIEASGSSMVGPIPGNASFHGCVELIGDYDGRRIGAIDVNCPPGSERWTARGSELTSVVELVGERADEYSTW